MADDPNLIESKLFSHFSEEAFYARKPEVYQAHLLDQYKLYVEMADKISERRQTANSYFLSVNTALLGLVGYVALKDSTDYLWILGIAGLTLSYLWYRLVRSYRDLNTAKFNVIHAIEKRLPISPYDAEWEAMEKGKNPKLYKPVTHVEIGVPWVFVVLHVFVFIRTFPWQIVHSWVFR